MFLFGVRIQHKIPVFVYVPLVLRRSRCCSFNNPKVWLPLRFFFVSECHTSPLLMYYLHPSLAASNFSFSSQTCELRSKTCITGSSIHPTASIICLRRYLPRTHQPPRNVVRDARQHQVQPQRLPERLGGHVSPYQRQPSESYVAHHQFRHKFLL